MPVQLVVGEIPLQAVLLAPFPDFFQHHGVEARLYHHIVEARFRDFPDVLLVGEIGIHPAEAADADLAVGARFFRFPGGGFAVGAPRCRACVPAFAAGRLAARGVRRRRAVRRRRRAFGRLTARLGQRGFPAPRAASRRERNRRQQQRRAAVSPSDFPCHVCIPPVLSTGGAAPRFSLLHTDASPAASQGSIIIP